MSQSEETTPTAQPTAHPPGLYALFTTEMWERFSYYGMRALLVLYLTKAVGYERPDALRIYAVYTGLVYLTPLIGGRLADLYLGQRKAVFIGGILMALGQFALTRPELLSLGLGLMIVGNGFFKPNISVMVGSLYPQGDPRRDGAYTIFYMGINLGAFFAPLVSGYLGERLGWSYGFASAGVGMTFGVLTFAFTQRLLKGAGMPPVREAVNRSRLSPRDWIEIILNMTTGLLTYVFKQRPPQGEGTSPEGEASNGETLSPRDWAEVVLFSGFTALLIFGLIESWPYLQPYWSPAWISTAAGAFLYRGLIILGGLSLFIWATEPKAEAEMDALHEPFTAVDWQRVGVIVVISLFSIVFWMGFEQSGGTLNLFADEMTNRSVFGWEIPASMFQAINPIFIITLAPLFSLLWTALSKRNFPLPSVAKQGLGLILVSLAFAVMFVAEREAKTGLVSPLWLVAVYFIFTVSELFLSPIGLSLITKLAHPRIASLMMALWFLSTAAANYLAGILENALQPYNLNLWAFLGVMSFVPGVLLLALTPVLVKMSHGRV